MIKAIFWRLQISDHALKASCLWNKCYLSGRLCPIPSTFSHLSILLRHYLGINGLSVKNSSKERGHRLRAMCLWEESMSSRGEDVSSLILWQATNNENVSDGFLVRCTFQNQFPFNLTTHADWSRLQRSIQIDGSHSESVIIILFTAVCHQPKVKYAVIIWHIADTHDDLMKL